MAFIDMPRKVRPWKRGLSGLGLVATSGGSASSGQMTTAAIQALLTQAAADDKKALELDMQADMAGLKAGSPESSRADAQISFYRQHAAGRRADAAKAQSALNAQIASGQKVAGLIPMPSPGSSPTRAASGAAATTALATKGKASAGWSTGDASAIKPAYAKAVADTREEASSTSFSDVLNSIADVIGVAAPVADRIVQSEQQRRAETTARRAERAAANGIITSGQSSGAPGVQTSTVLYGVGGLVLVGGALWALSSLLGGKSPTVVVAK